VAGLVADKTARLVRPESFRMLHRLIVKALERTGTSEPVRRRAARGLRFPRRRTSFQRAVLSAQLPPASGLLLLRSRPAGTPRSVSDIDVRKGGFDVPRAPGGVLLCNRSASDRRSRPKS
jgi:hypothetical protein